MTPCPQCQDAHVQQPCPCSRRCVPWRRRPSIAVSTRRKRSLRARATPPRRRSPASCPGLPAERSCPVGLAFAASTLGGGRGWERGFILVWVARLRARPKDAIATPPDLSETRGSTGGNAAAVSVSLLLTSLLGVGQAVVLAFLAPDELSRDAFFAAYAIYLPIAVFAASMRASIIPLLGPIESDDRGFAARATGVLGSCSLAGLACAVAVVLATPILREILGAQLTADAKRDFVVVLLLLTAAAYLHVHAALLSSVLAGARNFRFSALWYPASGALGLAISAGALPAIGVEGAAMGVLAGTTLLAAAHTVKLRRYGVTVNPLRGLRSLGQTAQRGAYLVGNAALGWSTPLALAIAVAALPAAPGAITAYTYAFFLVLLMLNVSSLPIGLVRLPDFVELARSEGPGAVRELVAQTHVFALAAFVPLVVLVLAFGDALLAGIFHSAMPAETIATMAAVAESLCVLAFGTLVFQLSHAAAVALGRWRVSFVVCVLGLVVLASVLALAGEVGAVTVAIIHSTVICVSAVALVVALFGRESVPFAAKVCWGAAPGLALAFVCALPRIVVGEDPGLPAALLAAGCGLALYAALTVLLRPVVRRPIQAALGSRTAPSVL